jgi:hypothetical protein
MVTFTGCPGSALKLLLPAACLVVGLALAQTAGAVEERRGSLGNVGAGIENCVSQDWIHFGNDDQSAVLDEADHRRVRAEMIRRYPVIEGDGFPTSRVILWQRSSGDLLYIAVIDNPNKPGESCFSATFAAERFDLTLLLRRKYLVVPGGTGN